MLRVFEPNLGPQEAEAAWRQVMSRKVSPGEKVAEFESLLCVETGAKHAICCNSGTTALMLAIRCMCSSSVVAVPSYGLPAAANAARLSEKQVACYSILPDLCGWFPKHWHEDASGKLLEGDETNGAADALYVFVSHNGDTSRWPEIRDTAAAFGHSALHDAATALGMVKLDNHDTAILSFSGPKVVTTGAGGCVLTNKERIADRVRRLLDHGGGAWRKTRIHEAIGGNFRMSDLNAAIGCVQMQRLPELLAVRHERFNWYRKHFPEMPDGWCAIVRCEQPNESIARLADAGFEALRPYRPVQESAPFRENPVDPVAVSAANECLYLPVHHLVQESDVDKICSILKESGPCKSIV